MSWADVVFKFHPTLNILVGSDGSVIIPSSKYHKGHRTFGSKTSKGYRAVLKSFQLVHRLVLETFVGPCPEGFECNHKNRDRPDNRLDNLEWVTKSENMRNTANNDRCFARLGIHCYDDIVEYNRRNCSDWYHRNKESFNAKRRKKSLATKE